MEKSGAKKPGLLARVARFTPGEFRRVTADMYQQNLQLAEVNKTLLLLRRIEGIVLEPGQSLPAVSQQIAAAVVEEHDSCVFAALLYRQPSVGTTETLLGWAHRTPGQPVSASAHASLAAARVVPDAMAENERVFVTGHDEPALARLLGMRRRDMVELLADHRAHEVYASRLVTAGGSVGLLLLGLWSAETSSDKRLLARVSDTIRTALENKALQQENEVILAKLRRSNQKLKVIDEAKDEFISIASHQLRTPLTSVKGYLSMVLDGDVGVITSEQRRVLEEAFASSQRMVYLIGDFLNVSRLQTGKFELEPSRVLLPAIIQDEIDQLRATAEARNVQLVYSPPASFPPLMVDETKIRQVMMNFIDNAIYYAKPGGGRVAIELARHPHHVSFRVRDNGIGVPKEEAHSLFTKFYRATNARRARPDGTGIGLFMARRVVVAHGGTIIFESVEGQGSTFGFRLPTDAKK